MPNKPENEEEEEAEKTPSKIFDSQNQTMARDCKEGVTQHQRPVVSSRSATTNNNSFVNLKKQFFVELMKPTKETKRVKWRRTTTPKNMLIKFGSFNYFCSTALIPFGIFVFVVVVVDVARPNHIFGTLFCRFPEVGHWPATRRHLWSLRSNLVHIIVDVAFNFVSIFCKFNKIVLCSIYKPKFRSRREVNVFLFFLAAWWYQKNGFIFCRYLTHIY